MNSTELKARTTSFAHRCVKAAASLPKNKLGSHIEGQLVRCATSVAVNYRAVVLAQSTPSFAAKLSIVLEEADECIFWLEFAFEEKILSNDFFDPLIKEAKELTAIFVSSRKTIQSKLSK